MKEKKDEYIPEKCHDCGADVMYYHGDGGTRIVCRKKCNGYKVIASAGFRQKFQKGDVI